MILFNAQLLYAQETKVLVSSVEANREEFQGFNVLDGNRDTRWSSSFEDKQTLKIILPKAQRLENLRIFWDNSHAKHYKIKVSENKKKWTLIYNEKNKKNASLDFIELREPQLVKYINFDFCKRNTEYGYSIFEIKFNDQILKKFLAQGNDGSEQLNVSKNQKKIDKSVERKIDENKDILKPQKTDKLIHI
jgi:hypothetical protein